MTDATHGLVRRMPAPEPIDLRLTLGPLQHGRGDLTIQFESGTAWLALRLESGPATLRLREQATDIEAVAWGRGAEAALDAAPGLAGLLDEPDALVPWHHVVRHLQRRFAGLRLPRTGQLWPSLVPAVIEQKVTSTEAHAAYTRLLRKTGEPAPEAEDGPRLLLPPSGDVLAALPYFEYHPLGLERRRAEVLRGAGRAAAQIEALMQRTPAEAREALQRLPGIGRWTAAEVTRAAFGDPDAVSVGDAHIPSMVCWALAAEEGGDDERMLELLEPYAGQRGRVIRLLEAAGIHAPRRGPRMPPRSIAGI